METQEKSLNTFISLENFKVLMGVDDKEDRTARFGLLTASLSIEQYYKRKFLKKQYFEVFKWTSHLQMILKEYPVSVVFSRYYT